MQYAGVAIRFVAVLIDLLVYLVLVVVLATLFGDWQSTNQDGVHTFSIKGEVWPLLVFLAYYVGSEALAGKTIGKRAVGLRVVDESGQAIGIGQAVIRNVLRIIDGLFFYLVGAIAAWSSPKRQRLGDRAAGTVVVHDSGGLGERVDYTPPPSERPWSPRPDDSSVYYTQERFMDDLARAKRAEE